MADRGRGGGWTSDLPTVPMRLAGRSWATFWAPPIYTINTALQLAPPDSEMKRQIWVWTPPSFSFSQLWWCMIARHFNTSLTIFPPASSVTQTNAKRPFPCELVMFDTTDVLSDPIRSNIQGGIRYRYFVQIRGGGLILEHSIPRSGILWISREV